MSLEEEIQEIKTDCSRFNGYMPCLPHKKEGVHCDNCSYYNKAGRKILIIKLGAAGEILRVTPLLRKLKKEHSDSKIFWITEYPELLPEKELFRIYNFNQKTSELLRALEFDLLYSLDKHEETGALANRLNSKIKKGFSQREGVIIPFDEDALEKWKTGIYDDVMKRNKKHYVQEIFEICGFQFSGEEYMLPDYTAPEVNLDRSKKVVALNTGSGNSWKPRNYSSNKWNELAKKLIDANYEVVLTGGPQEDQKNKGIAEVSGAKYFGTFPYRDFIGLLSLSDIIVTPVTFALHAAIGLGKKIVLLNNVFNKNEFYMYGRGTILEPKLSCVGCYKNYFHQYKKCEIENCMDSIKTERVIEEIEKFK